MEPQQLSNLIDIYRNTGDDGQRIRVIIPGPTPVSMGILSLSPSVADGCLYLVLDDEDVVEL